VVDASLFASQRLFAGRSFGFAAARCPPGGLILFVKEGGGQRTRRTAAPEGRVRGEPMPEAARSARRRTRARSPRQSVAQQEGDGKGPLSRAERRALARGFSQALVRIESAREQQQALRHVLDLAAKFQRGLDAAQRERWLLLEEALLDQQARLQRSHFRAGFECGRKYGAQRTQTPLPRCSDGRVEVATTGAAEVPVARRVVAVPAARIELIAELARLISELVAHDD
jgi:hypothetical protein